MATNIAELLVKIGADSYQFTQVTKQVEADLKKLGDSMTKIGKDLSLKLTAPLAALGVVSAKLADTQLKAEAKVKQAIISTQGAANLSFGELADFASKLQEATNFGDEEILAKSTAQLLTFTNIAGENFKKTQEAALDLSTMMGGDLQSASIQLGKALNSPVANLSALGRSGIQFSEDQKAVIKQLVETNRLADAQSIILKELNRQFGGQAEAARDPIIQLKNLLGDLGEDIGEIFLPILRQCAENLKGVVKWIIDLDPKVKVIIVSAAALAAAIGPILLAMGTLVKLIPVLTSGATAFAAVLPALKTGLVALTTPVGALTAAVVALAAAWAFAKSRQSSYLKELSNEALDKARSMSDEELKDSIASGQNTADNLTSGFSGKVSSLAYKSGLFGSNPTTASPIALPGALAASTQAQVDAFKQVLAEREELKRMQEDAKKVAASVQSMVTSITGVETATTEKISEVLTGSILSDSATFELPFSLKLANLKPVTSEINNSLKQISDAIQNDFFGWADLTTGKFDDQVLKLNDSIKEYAATLVDKGYTIAAATKKATDDTLQLMSDISSATESAVESAITGTFEAFGEALAGEEGWRGVLNALVESIGSYLKTLGTLLIEYAVTMQAFKTAFKSVLANPWAAIAVGAAMVATGAAMSSLVKDTAENDAPKLANGGLAYGPTYAMVGDNRNAMVDPEVIAPLSKLQKMFPGSANNQNVNISLTGGFELTGRTIRYLLKNDNYSVSLLGR
ncbi:MAG: hypothetical protein SNH18_09410 [Rikenellaceae bacterium]